MMEILKPNYDVTGEVLFEQLEYLVGVRVEHLNARTSALGSCNECACNDCLRYSRVREILMEAFQEEKYDCGVSQKRGKAHKAGG